MSAVLLTSSRSRYVAGAVGCRGDGSSAGGGVGDVWRCGERLCLLASFRQLSEQYFRLALAFFGIAWPHCAQVRIGMAPPLPSMVSPATIIFRGERDRRCTRGRLRNDDGGILPWASPVGGLEVARPRCGGGFAAGESSFHFGARPFDRVRAFDRVAPAVRRPAVRAADAASVGDGYGLVHDEAPWIRRPQAVVDWSAADVAVGAACAIVCLHLPPAVAVMVAWIAHGISHRVMRQAADAAHEPMMAISMSMPPPF